MDAYRARGETGDNWRIWRGRSSRPRMSCSRVWKLRRAASKASLSMLERVRTDARPSPWTSTSDEAVLRWRWREYWAISSQIWRAERPDHSTHSRILPSLKRRSSAFSPQNWRNLAASFCSSAGGPCSIWRVMWVSSKMMPTVMVWDCLAGWPLSFQDFFSGSWMCTSCDLLPYAFLRILQTSDPNAARVPLRSACFLAWKAAGHWMVRMASKIWRGTSTLAMNVGSNLSAASSASSVVVDLAWSWRRLADHELILKRTLSCLVGSYMTGPVSLMPSGLALAAPKAKAFLLKSVVDRN